MGLQRPVRARADWRARADDPGDAAGIGDGDPLAPVDAEGLFLTVRASAAADSRVKEVEGRFVERSSVLLRDRHELVVLSLADLEPGSVLLVSAVVGSDSWQGGRSGNVGGLRYHAGDKVNEGV